MSETPNLKLFKHDKPSENEEPFDVEKALNKNWDAVDNFAQDVIDKNSKQDADIADINEKNSNQDASIKSNKDNIDIINVKNNEQDIDIQNNKKNIDNINIKDNEQDTIIQSIKEDIAPINEKNNNQDKEIEAIKEKNSKQDKEVESIHIKNTEQDSLVEELKAECERLNNDKRAIAISVNEKAEYLNLKGTSNSRFNKFEICGNIKQETREGRNLYDVHNKDVQRFESVYSVDEDDFVTLETIDNSTGTSTVYKNAFTLPNSNLKANTQYYLVIEVKKVSGTGSIVVISASDAGSASQFKTAVSYSFANLKAGDVKIVPVTSRDDLSAVFTMLRTFTSFAVGESGSITYRISILETEPTVENFKYEKYGECPSFEYPSDLKTVKDNINLKVSNKNIFGVYNKSTGSFPAQYNIDDEDWISLKDIDNTIGTSTKFFNAFTKKTNCLKENKEYSLVFEVKEVSGDGIIHVVDTSTEGSTGQFKTAVTYNFSDLKTGDIKIHKITTREDFKNCITLLRTYVAFRAGQAGSITFRLSLLETEPTIENFVYTKHEEQLHTIPVQQEMLEKDRFIKKDGKWYEQHNFGYASTLNNESITATKSNTSTDDFFRYTVGLSAINRKTGRELKIYCSHTKFANSRWSAVEGICGWETGTSFCLGTFNKELDTAEKLLAYLKANDIKVYYELAEPILIECTEEQSAILDEIEKTIHTYKDMTYVFSDDEISSICNVSYNVDTKTYIDNQINNQISAISKVLLENGGN